MPILLLPDEAALERGAIRLCVAILDEGRREFGQKTVFLSRSMPERVGGRYGFRIRIEAPRDGAELAVLVRDESTRALTVTTVNWSGLAKP